LSDPVTQTEKRKAKGSKTDRRLSLPQETSHPGRAQAEQILDYHFDRPSLLDRALTHTSATSRRGAAAFERLEFLGDRVLGLIIADLLMARFKGEREGELARRFTELVRKDTLASVMDHAGLAALLVQAPVEGLENKRKGGGELSPGTLVQNAGVLADSCEAVIAALYLDGGLDAARHFVSRWWQPLMEQNLTPPKDAKTRLQEWALGRSLQLPNYRVVAEEGPPHDRLFTIDVSICDRKNKNHAAQGQGSSKRNAEQEAAKALLEILMSPQKSL